MRYPVKKVYITQDFGANPDDYKKWGYQGHNGIDFRAFNPDGNRCYTGGKSEVFAPHCGKIIENAFDPEGYGWYVKIENAVEGSILAHFSEQCGKKVGDEVNEGDFLAYQGTTGNSTAVHLHWGYYRHPRDRQNGYGGMIDQKPFLIEPTPSEPQEDPRIIELQKEIDAKNVQIGNYAGQVEGLIKERDQLSKDLGTARSDLEGALKSAKMAQEALANFVNNDQLVWADRLEKEQDAHKITKDILEDLVFELEELAKLSHGSDKIEVKVSKVLAAMKAIEASKTVITGLSDYKTIIKLFGTLIYRS